MSDVTRILSEIEQGDHPAAEQLLPLVYDELRRLAAQTLAKEKPGQTLQATALVDEAYLRFLGAEHAQNWNSRGHFFGAAAEAMRRILVDNARRTRRPEHGGDRKQIPLDAITLRVEDRFHDLLAFNEALNELARQEPRKAELVRLRYFAGLSVEEAAACLGISAITAKRYCAVARAWLYAALSDEEVTGPAKKTPRQGDTSSSWVFRGRHTQLRPWLGSSQFGDIPTYPRHWPAGIAVGGARRISDRTQNSRCAPRLANEVSGLKTSQTALRLGGSAQRRHPESPEREATGFHQRVSSPRSP